MQKCDSDRRWRRGLWVVVAASLAWPLGPAWCDPADAAVQARQIEQLRICLAQRLARLDEEVLDMNRRLRREHEQEPIRLNSANAEARLVREQLRAVETAYGELVSHAENGDLPRARGAFVEGLLALECAALRMQLVDELLRARRPWYPEGVSVWTSEHPDDPGVAPSFEAPDWPPPPPPAMLDI